MFCIIKIYLLLDNTCCRKILLATNSEHRNVQSDIWGEYTICNRTYDDNRAGIITYMNANKIEFFGGKGRYDIMWRVIIFFIYN